MGSRRSSQAAAPSPTRHMTRPKAGQASAEHTPRGALRRYQPNPRTPHARDRVLARPSLRLAS
eukprot:8658651-Alexandrium_andersonii.AAC.1